VPGCRRPNSAVRWTRCTRWYTHDTPATQHAREIVSGAASSYVSAFGTTMLTARLLCLGAAGAIALLMRGAQASDATAGAEDPLPATGRARARQAAAS
jgi:hypothetical protein